PRVPSCHESRAASLRSAAARDRAPARPRALFAPPPNRTLPIGLAQIDCPRLGRGERLQARRSRRFLLPLPRCRPLAAWLSRSLLHQMSPANSSARQSAVTSVSVDDPDWRPALRT